MKVLKVVAEGTVTSFRYPHFMIAVQPTYEVPPPATLYGHICSSLGEWFDPVGVKFAIHFTYEAKFEDVEHTHIVEASTGTLEGTTYPKTQWGNINPYIRELLFRPKMVLYLNKPEWADAFRCPKYPVVLGRSQDLFSYRKVEIVNLIRGTNAYFEHTLAPYELVRHTSRGVALLMPRYLRYEEGRFPEFERYVMLCTRVHFNDMLQIPGSQLDFWLDPSARIVNGDCLGLFFHGWISDGEA
ncbi:MAG: CRISPR-associated protein Cas5 [Bacillota bacterium]